jgi:nicotinamidase-related amidase
MKEMDQSALLEDRALVNRYQEAGFGGRVGWGQRPALIVIDMAKAWIDPGEQLGSDQAPVLRNIVTLLETARDVQIPIYFTTNAYGSSLRDVGVPALRKKPGLAKLKLGSEAVELAPELGRQETEPLIVKPRPSAFFATNLRAMLRSDGCDTIIVTGCTTSGCVRSTCDSGMNENFHVIVPRECVGDRNPSAGAASLFDIDQRYGDVVAVREVVDHLGSLREERGQEQASATRGAVGE